MSPRVRRIDDGSGRTVLVVVAHADDVALFIGGTVAALTAAEWRVVVVRATDDRFDSVDSTESETIEANRRELRASLDVLGVAELVELDLMTDHLGDASTVRLRERVIHAIRMHRPYALVSFDPYAMYGEDNLDHIAVARASDEAFWTSQFDLHHPEHFEDGLEPHGCFERWYFGRRVVDVTDVVDISSTIDKKIEAACCHRTMLLNIFNQFRLQARTGGWELPMIDAALEARNIDSVLPDLLRASAERTGSSHGLSMAEEFRTVTFGGMHELLDSAGVRL